ncbi:hypothetical protein [Wenzhouxiangella sediminis]|uniref:hypothetical protein n=1 Tax=Wenzhouxiangella sediminis TaxID=1792836 RepID=UPI0011C036D8|nr:hypothetical protein [Wenzhouxiangella sediminis]
MTTLCIDELSRSLKRRWGWSNGATHVPADAGCPLLSALPASGDSGAMRRQRASLPEWLQPMRGHAGPPGIAAFHGKTSPSVG